MTTGRRIEIKGTVQGVGFRPWVYRLARGLGVQGLVRNDERGVTIDAYGPAALLDAFILQLREKPPPAASIKELGWQPLTDPPPADFAIAASQPTAERRVCIPPDLATCSDCQRELNDPADRRYHYPFTNCTNCGPRFTIAQDEPYDRAFTTMAPFVLCPSCKREYESPEDRRFHAEPNACPVCGPRLQALSEEGAPVKGDPIELAARTLAEGRVVAVKGIGGFHLACDATSPDAVRLLRERKRREERPFAVMPRDLGEARHLALLTPDEEALLTSVERPIVLVQRREKSALCDEIAPKNPWVGLLLPYSPLHHLLLAAAGRPLVMTSGNLSDQPICYRNDEAISRLRGIADLFLVHDREIETRCDDSVARVIAGRPVVLRRSRGYVPRPIALQQKVKGTVLAVGGHLKNTFCIAEGDQAVLGPHIGDLDGLQALDSLARSAARMERFLRVRPEIIAHDLHPDYGSTLYARERPEPTKVGVQHHHAHVASAMAEHGLQGPVIGVAYDGSGWGPDGTSWGGEILLCTYAAFERIATFRPIPLAGGERAIRQVWRVALALLDDALGRDFDLSRLKLFDGILENDVQLVREMVRERINTPLARGVGRYFDALGALLLGRTRATYEGQAALEVNALADPQHRGAYPYEIVRAQDPWELDLRPMVRAVVQELIEGVPGAAISASFHDTLAAATAHLVGEAARQHGRLPVVLTGGCFQNARLAEGVQRALGGELQLFLHRDVPPGDGGLALGQALVADAVARGAS